MMTRTLPSTSQAPDSEVAVLHAALKDQVSRAAHQHGNSRLTVLLNGDDLEGAVGALLEHPDVASVIVPADADIGNDQIRPDDMARIGRYDKTNGRWQLPEDVAPAMLVYGAPLTASLPMALAACRKGCFRYLQPAISSWQSVHFFKVILRRAIRATALITMAAIQRIETNGPNPNARFIVKVLYRTRAHKIGERILKTLAERVNGRQPQASPLQLTDAPLLQPHHFKRGEVLMVNSALAWGGAERQLVNSMLGLSKRGYKVSLVCEALNYVPDSDFFSWRLDNAQVDVQSIRRQISDYGDLIPEPLALSASERIEKLPSPFRENIAPYVMELLAHRPEVVHAWQDQTSLMVGVAAAIVGVPRIILSTRNVSPPNFAYFQPHMRETYQALLKVPNLRIINNSKAGAEDYARWLDVSASDFDLLYNGIDFDLMQPVARDEQEAYRAALGIEPSQKVVGSIFRLYEEKDPMLWLQTAAEIAKADEDTVFLIIGVGPMKDELLALSRELGMGGRLLLPGTEKRPEKALAIMDLFLLTSRFEGLPNVVIEAQSQGVPVVTTRAGGSGEAILSGETGWLVETRNSSDLAAKALHILNNPQWAENARLNAPQFAKERFGYDRMIQETTELYDSIPA